MPSDSLESVFDPHTSSHGLAGGELTKLPLNALTSNQKNNCNAKRARNGDHHGDFLCIGRLEARLGRRLMPDDFTGAVINLPDRWHSERLNARLAGS